MMSAKRESLIIEAAAPRSSSWCSQLYALAYATFSNTSCEARPRLVGERGVWVRDSERWRLGANRANRAAAGPRAPVRDGRQPAGPERALRVDVQALALAAAALRGQLAGAAGGAASRASAGRGGGGGPRQPPAHAARARSSRTWQATASMWHSCVLPARTGVGREKGEGVGVRATQPRCPAPRRARAGAELSVQLGDGAGLDAACARGRRARSARAGEAESVQHGCTHPPAARPASCCPS